VLESTFGSATDQAQSISASVASELR
jgi:hypothetical protein